MTNNFTEQLVTYFKEFSNENSDDFDVFKNHITKVLNQNIKPISGVTNSIILYVFYSLS